MVLATLQVRVWGVPAAIVDDELKLEIKNGPAVELEITWVDV